MRDTASHSNLACVPRRAGRAPLRVITAVSGKGGAGKTCVIANLAVALAHRGCRTCVLDAAFGLPNPDVLLGLTPTHNVARAPRGDCTLTEVVAQGPAGICLIPSPAAGAELIALTPEDQLRLLEEVDGLDGVFDLLLVDTGTGISARMLYFAAAATETIILITPEPSSVTGASALLWALRRRYRRREFLVVVNMAANALEADAAFAHLGYLTATVPDIRIEYQGFVPRDDALVRAIREQRSVVLSAPTAPASVAIGKLANRLLLRPLPAPTGGLQFGYQRLIEP